MTDWLVCKLMQMQMQLRSWELYCVASAINDNMNVTQANANDQMTHAFDFKPSALSFASRSGEIVVMRHSRPVHSS